MIYVYPSVLPGEPLETHDADGITVEHWLVGTVPEYEPRSEPPISIAVNGQLVEPERWGSVVIRRADHVEIRPQPKGGGLIVGAIIAAVVAVAATVLLKPSIPRQQNKRSSAKGGQIAEASAQANQPRLGDVIPEIAGRRKRYPDYLTAPCRRFSGPKEQELDLLLCLGKGEFDIESDSVLIGNTPVEQLASAVNYQIFEPGQSVTGHRAHERWYNAPEVGQSVGASGIRLRSTRDLEQTWPGSISLSGNTMSGAGQPEGWVSGTRILLKFKQKVIVTTASDGFNEFEMAIGHVPHAVGDRLQISGVPGIGGTIEPGLVEIKYMPETGKYRLNYQRRIDDGSGIVTVWVTHKDIADGEYNASVYPPGQSSFGATINGTTTGGVTLSKSFPSATTSVSANLDSGQKTGVWSLPFAVCPKGEVTSRIEFDVFAPQGLGHINDNGDIESRSRTIQLRYRPVGGSGWTTVSRNITGRTRDQLGWTWGINLSSSMRAEVQVRRSNSESNSTQDMDRLEWYGLRAKLTAKSSYPGVTVIAMTVKGSDTIASQTENQISAVVTRKLPELDGSGGWTAPTAAWSIPAWFAHVAKSAGYTDDDLDLEELSRLDGIWRARGDGFDYIESEDSTVKESLNRCLLAGMSELTVDAGKLRPVRDEPRSTFEQMYTPQNMREPLSRSVSAPRPDDPDGVDVEFTDAETWEDATVECRLPGDAGVRAEKLSLPGVTNRTRAWRIGMRRRRELKYRRWEYSFSTELDALNSRYMSYCALADDIPGYAQSALVEGVEVDGPDVHLLSSEPLEWQTGKSHVIAWRRPDGTLAGPFPAQPGDDERHVIAQMDEVPVIDYQREPPHLLFGTTDEWSFPVLITSINPRGFESVSVDAVGYDARVYEDDNGVPN